MAAAIGIGVDVEEPMGNMIIDIGGGTSEIAVIALGGIVCDKSIRVAGDDFTSDIEEYMRRQHNILIGERVALNFVSHISGIATKTNMFVKKVGKKTKICCTRKTIPNLRVIQKYAVKLGGGTNHRFNLSDEYLIKDNHISAEKNFENLIQRAIKKKGRKKITVEVDNLSQLKRILGLKFDRILLDNMSSKDLKKAVRMSRKFYETEASGGISLKNVKNVSSTGVDRISIGSLTHSMNALDLKLEI